MAKTGIGTREQQLHWEHGNIISSLREQGNIFLFVNGNTRTLVVFQRKHGNEYPLVKTFLDIKCIDFLLYLASINLLRGRNI